MPIKADHVLTVLSLIVLMMMTAPIAYRGSEPRLLVKHDCALFYGPIGPEAERDCRLNMLKSHSLPPDAE